MLWMRGPNGQQIVRFADKPSHGLFLEPEGWQTDEVYVQGANTSLPEDVQIVEVPKYRQYRYVILNNRRVIVDSGTRRVVAVYP